MPLDQTPELFTPDESAYHTARRASSCPREPPTSNSSTRENKGTDERRTLAFDSSAEEESVPRCRSSSKNHGSDAKASPTRHPPKSSRSSTSRTKEKTNAKASPTRHSPRSSTRSSHQKRRSSSSRSGERSTSRSASRSRFTRETRIRESNSKVTSSTYSHRRSSTVNRELLKL